MSFVTASAATQNFSRNATLNLLRRFEPMTDFDWHSLATLARLAHEVVVPAKRLLVRPPRRMDGVWYLCSGTVCNEQTGERFVAGSQRCRVPIYPGQSSLRCVSAVRLLYFDASAARLFHLQGDLDDSGGSVNTGYVEDLTNASAATHWLETLAGSPVLRLLYRRRGASGWQRWLRELEPVVIARGQQLIAPGVAGECFYIVQTGVALVEVAGGHRPLAQVAAGGFFGEDAVLTGGLRNARVHMPMGGRVLRGEARQLRALVGDLWWMLAREPDSWRAGSEPLQIASVLDAQALRRQIAGLNKSVSYGLCVGNDNEQLNLALLLLVHHGYRIVLSDGSSEAKKISPPASPI